MLAGVIIMETQHLIIQQLNSYTNPEKAAFLPHFFQAYPGGYGEGDCFIGVTVPDQRKVARKYYRTISLEELTVLIQSNVHEHRLTAIFILVLKYEKTKSELEKENLVNFYLNNISAVNNWDLVDSSAYKILGAFLFDKDRSLLYHFAASGGLWPQRIAIISTLYFIKRDDFVDTLKIADSLLEHDHDLIHKAVGWMLREVGNRDFAVEYNYLKDRYRRMPRTMLRYAIEKFEPELRKQFLEGKIQ